MLDRRVFGKPSVFAGTDKTKWREFEIVFMSYMSAMNATLHALILATQDNENDLINATLDANQAEQSRQLHFMLIQLVQGTALDIVVNAGDGNETRHGLVSF